MHETEKSERLKEIKIEGKGSFVITENRNIMEGFQCMLERQKK